MATTPKNYDEFMNMAANFVQKAKAKAADDPTYAQNLNTKVGNTLKFMFQMMNQEQSRLQAVEDDLLARQKHEYDIVSGDRQYELDERGMRIDEKRLGMDEDIHRITTGEFGDDPDFEELANEDASFDGGNIDTGEGNIAPPIQPQVQQPGEGDFRPGVVSMGPESASQGWDNPIAAGAAGFSQPQEPAISPIPQEPSSSPSFLRQGARFGASILPGAQIFKPFL